MSREDIFMRLEGIFKDIFDDEGIVISESTKKGDITGWDSQTTNMIIREVENEFNITLSGGEKRNLTSVGSLASCIEAKSQFSYDF